MTDMYIENDPYDWFDRLNMYETDIKNICNNNSSIDTIVLKTRKYFLDHQYSIKESIDTDNSYRYLFYSDDRDESIVFVLEAEMNLYFLSLSIHNENITDISSYSTKDNPNEFFSMFLN